MGYKSSNIVPFLAHNKPIKLNNLLIEYFLWYTTSFDSYIQRTTKFDNSIFDKSSLMYSPIVDYCFLLILFNRLHLDKLKFYQNKIQIIDNDIDNISTSDCNKNLLYLHYGAKSSLFAFFDKMRNSIAHGTFNIYQNKILMIGQYKPKITSLYNFYLQINLNEKDNNFNSIIDNEILDLNNLLKMSLSLINGITIEDNHLIFKNSEIILNTDFQFINKSSISQKDQLYIFFNELQLRNKIIILANQYSNLTLENMYFDNLNIQIVPYNKFIEYFDIQNIDVINS